MIQDDNDDWKHETAAMADIDFGAHLTLTAVKARSSTEMLFANWLSMKSFCRILS
jgi:hypothetical protein